MARKKKSLGLRLLFVALVTIALAAATVLVVEDMLGVPYEAPRVENPDLSQIAQLLNNQLVFDTIKELLEQHPEWAEAIAEYIMQNFDMSNLSLEDLQMLCQLFPNLQSYLGDFLLSQLLNGEDLPLTPEPGKSMGLARPNIDNGDLNPAALMMPLFSVDSDYAGRAYIRSTSWGDYDPVERTFLNAPAFDGSTYVASPVLFSSYAAYSSGARSYNLTFHLSSHRDYGTLVGDVPGLYYTVGGDQRLFASAAENRLWLIDDDTYTVPFYPVVDYSTSYISNSSVAEDEARYHRFVRASYRAVPEEMKAGLQAFLDENHLTKPEEVVGYLRNHYSYSIQTMDCPKNENIIFYFLNEKKAGTCTNFASAATLLCRQLGVPTRFVTGYLTSLKAERNNLVLGKDAHAWIEIFVNGVGWQRLEPTASQATKEPDATYDLNGDPSTLAPDIDRELFTFTTGYNGDVYFPDYAYGDYDMRNHAFAAEVEEAPENALSWFTASSVLERNSSMPYAITINRHGDFQGHSAVTASYGSFNYSLSSVSSASEFAGMELFSMVSDSRLKRISDELYTHLFYPEGDPRESYFSANDAEYSAFASRAYTNVPFELETVLNDYLANEHLTNPDEVMANLSSYHYSVGAVPSSLDPIEDLLSGTHTGVPKTFAGAMVLLARKLGYPARYAEGFKSVRNPLSSGGERSVSLRDTYAWAELYYSGKGWVRFDPMPTIYRNQITDSAAFSLQNVEVRYDGQPHSATVEDALTTPSNLEQILLPGDRVSVSFTGASQNKTDAGAYRIRGELRVYDHWGKDVTTRYPNFTFSGTAYLNILQREIIIKTNNAELPYNTSEVSRYYQ